MINPHLISPEKTAVGTPSGVVVYFPPFWCYAADKKKHLVYLEGRIKELQVCWLSIYDLFYILNREFAIPKFLPAAAAGKNLMIKGSSSHQNCLGLQIISRIRISKKLFW